MLAGVGSFKGCEEGSVLCLSPASGELLAVFGVPCMKSILPISAFLFIRSAPCVQVSVQISPEY